MHVSNLPLLQGKKHRKHQDHRPRQDPFDGSRMPGRALRRGRLPALLRRPHPRHSDRAVERAQHRIVEPRHRPFRNNYHTAFYACENVFIGNLKMHEVQCVSGDGLGLGVGTHNVKIVRAFLESNDDGVVLGPL